MRAARLALLLLLLLIGCGKRPSLVGKWSAMIEGQPCTFEFKPGTKMRQTMKTDAGDIVIEGQYLLGLRTITMTMKRVSVENAPKGTEAEMETVAQKKMKDLLDHSESSKLDFTSENEATFSGRRFETVRLTRVP